MSQNTNLVAVNLENLPSTQLGTDQDFAEISRGGDFLGRLQLFSKGKLINRGLISPGHWGVPEGDEVIDLGSSVDLLVFAKRPKALDLSDKEAVVMNYDPSSDEFQRIQNQSSERDSGCMFGPSFLVFERSTKRFLEFFCGTKSFRPEGKKIFPFMPLTPADIQAKGIDAEPHGPIPFTMKTRLVETKSYSWHVPVIVKCSTPFTEVPPTDMIIKEMKSFISPSNSQVEGVSEEEAQTRRAR